MGLAIIGFSLLLRVVLSPLTKPYMDSMRKMKEIAPELQKLKSKHKDDKIKFAKAQADFYKEKGINPGAGCLPYLLQIVVLIAFFNVFSRTLAPGTDIVANFNHLLYDFLKFKPGETINLSFLYLNISKPDVILLPFAKFNFPGPVLILSALVQFLSAKVMNPYIKAEEKIVKKSEEKSDDMQVAMQKSMTYTFPLFTLLIGTRFASGLALYWLIFSLTQMYQQVKSQGWGELTSLLKKMNLIKYS